MPIDPAIGSAERAAGIERLSQELAPHLAAAASASLGGDGAHSAGTRIMSPFTGDAAPTAPAAVDGRGRRPLVTEIGFAEGVSARQQEILWESLRRRKAPWSYEMARAGVKLDKPTPVFTVRQAKDVASGDGAVKRVDFVIEWSQGRTRLGAFRAEIKLADMKPVLRRLAPPPAPVETQMILQFRKAATDAEIEAFLDRNGLRLLFKNVTGTHQVAVTGPASADETARSLSAMGILLYATPVQHAVEEKDQVFVVLKKAVEADVALLFRGADLRVVEAVREGAYRVGAATRGSAAQTAARLNSHPLVLYATAVKAKVAESRKVILTFRRDVSPEEIAGFFKRHRLQVLADYGGGAYKVAKPRMLNGSLAAKLSQDAIVFSVVAVGAVSDERVRAAVAGTISGKGAPFSSTEYHLEYAMTKSNLELAGATEAQLELYSDLCNAAPVLGGRFNPWSGD